MDMDGLCIFVRENNGTYEIPGAAEPVDWLDVRTDANGRGAELDAGTELTGWGPWTRVYRISYPDTGETQSYFVAE